MEILYCLGRNCLITIGTVEKRKVYEHDLHAESRRHQQPQQGRMAALGLRLLAAPPAGLHRKSPSFELVKDLFDTDLCGINTNYPSFPGFCKCEITDTIRLPDLFFKFLKIVSLS